jgi:hypothetical protein
MILFASTLRRGRPLLTGNEMGIVAIRFLQWFELIQQSAGEHPAECASAKGSDTDAGVLADQRVKDCLSTNFYQLNWRMAGNAF